MATARTWVWIILGFVGVCVLGMSIIAGAGVIYFVLRMGKLFFGRQRVTLPAAAKIIFSETALHLPDQEIPYEEIFYRHSDSIKLHAHTIELCDRCYQNVPVRLSLLSKRLRIGDEELDPAQVTYMEVAAAEIVLPREAMGLGDVKFMAAIGAFLGWQAVMFSLLASSLIGSLVGVGLIAARRRKWSSRLPYGPYIALAATIWIFGGKQILGALFGR
jgi:leader peptidase (prepilin peptidase)/N-methyltransferase